MPSHFVTRLLQQSLKSSLSCSLLWVSQTKVRTLKRTLLRQILESFGIRKSHTTAYHPKGDGMVEQFNQSLLQLPCSYVDNEADWEWYLPLVLYAYCTAVHSSTGVSTYILMFGRQPQTTTSDKSSSFDPLSYQSQLTAKMAELHDFVESKLALAASKQKCSYNKRSNQRSFNVTILFWLSVPTAGKLDPKWEGNWRVHAVKGPVNVEIIDGHRRKVVHINRIQPRTIPSLEPNKLNDSAEMSSPSWIPPSWAFSWL